MFRLFSALFAATALVAQDPPPAKPHVRVPAFPNSTCPIMGKKISLPLFVDTEVGRIWLCCKPCAKKVLADVPTAHKTAYPTIADVANEVCPVSGEPIGEHKTTIVLQGFRLALCCAGCADAARQQSQITLARLHEPKLIDVANELCPVTDKPVAANTFAVIGEAIVRLSSPKLVAEVEKAPDETLAKAKEIAAKQPKPEPHRHVEKAADSAPAEGGK